MTFQQLKDEVVPLSKSQQISLWLIIACFFQFLLFFSPLLVKEVIAREQLKNYLNNKNKVVQAETVISNETVINNEIPTLNRNEIPALNRPMRVIRSSLHTITAYNSLPEQTDNQPCITANGFDVCQHGVEDTIAANFLRFGTKVRIPDLFGDRIFIVRDRMNRRHPNRVDVWMLEREDAVQFGIRRTRIEVVEYVN